jgi:hypothetical protein
MMAITTSSSTKVKPRRQFAFTATRRKGKGLEGNRLVSLDFL